MVFLFSRASVRIEYGVLWSCSILGLDGLFFDHRVYYWEKIILWDGGDLRGRREHGFLDRSSHVRSGLISRTRRVSSVIPSPQAVSLQKMTFMGRWLARKPPGTWFSWSLVHQYVPSTGIDYECFSPPIQHVAASNFAYELLCLMLIICTCSDVSTIPGSCFVLLPYFLYGECICSGKCA